MYSATPTSPRVVFSLLSCSGRSLRSLFPRLACRVLVGIFPALLVARVTVLDFPADTSALAGFPPFFFFVAWLSIAVLAFSVFFLGGLLLQFLVAAAAGPLRWSVSLIGLVPRRLQPIRLFSLILFAISSVAFLHVLGGVFFLSSVVGSGDSVYHQVFDPP